jgi:hypothetical protein
MTDDKIKKFARRPKNRFHLNSGVGWAVHEYKGKLRVVMNRKWDSPPEISRFDVLSVARVTQLVAWLNRYLGSVNPTDATVAAASIRAHVRGVNRGVESFERTMG